MRSSYPPARMAASSQRAIWRLNGSSRIESDRVGSSDARRVSLSPGPILELHKLAPLANKKNARPLRLQSSREIRPFSSELHCLSGSGILRAPFRVGLISFKIQFSSFDPAPSFAFRFRFLFLHSPRSRIRDFARAEQQANCVIYALAHSFEAHRQHPIGGAALISPSRSLARSLARRRSHKASHNICVRLARRCRAKIRLITAA